MDKSYDNSSSSNNTNNNGGSNINRDQLLKNLNKVSHKISKPTRKNTAFDNHQQQMRPPPPPPQPQHQPPVYNINMSDFRDVVQKLTGSQSQSNDRFSAPPPIQPPKQPSSRLQRIRPPPLPQIITTRPSLLMNNVILPPHPQPIGGGYLTNFRPPPPLAPPLSPLPPFPPVYTAAESPISAYIRCFLQDSVSNHQGISSLAPLISPKWNTNNNTDNVCPDPLPNVSAPLVPSQPPPSMFIPPFSPLPFGCLSPMSPYSVYSPGQLGFPQFPPSFT